MSIDVTLTADYVSADSLEVVKSAISASSMVDEVVYQKTLVDALNANLNRISMIIGIFVALLLFISYVLINNTVRLNVFARRFTIHTMKLVGATWGFIRRPFLLSNMYIGLLSGIIANTILGVGVYLLKKQSHGIASILPTEQLLIVGLAVIAFGVIICTLCAFLSVNRFLRMRKNDLYFI